MLFPAATYRLQFNRRFRFADARALVPYLHALGITDLYASPLLTARPGSSHGYDITDPTRLNPELGEEKEFAALAAELRRHGMGLLLDVVPNHMAAGSDNPWWADVLKNGRESPYATFFDIDWNPAAAGPGPAGKVLAPVLDRPYGEALENQELTVALAEDGFWLCYRNLRFPLNRASSIRILELGQERLSQNSGLHHPATAQLLKLIAELKKPPSQRKNGPPAAPPGESAAAGGTAGGFAGRETVWARLWRLYNEQPEIKAFLDENLQKVNGQKGDPESFSLLDRIIHSQYYRPAFWPTAREEINYRRFFDVSDLVSLRMEAENVFAATHALVLQLAAAGQVTGLRIDHVDGLYDPEAYLRRLQESLSKSAGGGAKAAGAADGEGPGPQTASFGPTAGEAGTDTGETAGAETAETAETEAAKTGKTAGRCPGFYVVAEKILGSGEELPAGWAVCSTTGYDFLNTLNGLLIDERSSGALDRLYARIGGPEVEKDFRTVVYLQKKKVMAELFVSEVTSLVRLLTRLARADRYGRDLAGSKLKEALTEITACLPVYRTYIRDFTVAQADRRYIESAVREAFCRRPAVRTAGTFLRRILLLEFPVWLTPKQKRRWLHFVMRWQQFTGPVMAKGFEDTALYVYNRLISGNEVGGNPGAPEVCIAEFHRRNRQRLARQPYPLNATSTHDTKRSEDVRARINVLSEIPGAWTRAITRWRRWNRPQKPVVNGTPVPDGNMELFIYQTLIGAWPLREEEVPSFRERLCAYLVKAAREAKIRTSWLDPDAAYERALIEFVRFILEPSAQNRFLPDFLRFQKIPAFYGALNSLAQVLLKIASPGVPDFYQGTELWNFSLVDPDNRRPVDFSKAAEMLAAIQNPGEATKVTRGRLPGKDSPPAGKTDISFVRGLLESWPDGRIKLYLTYRALHFRRSRPDLFARGEYLPIEAAGPHAGHVCAFARRLENDWVLTAVPRLSARLQAELRAARKTGPGPRPVAGRPESPPDTLFPPLTFPLGEAVWGDTSLLLPASAPDRWHNVLTRETLKAAEGVLPLALIFQSFPVSLLSGIV